MLRPLLALGVAATMVTAQPSTAAAQQKHGDVSGEGTISALDAQAILTFVVGLPLPAGYLPGNGVSVCDGRAVPGALDAQVVLKYAIGLDVSTTCVGQPFGPGATTVALTPVDSSVLVTKTRVFKAVLRQADGSLIKRPISWNSSAPAIAAIDSVKNDSLAYVRGVAPGSATISAFADGATGATGFSVVTSYAGIIITPQRTDTLHQTGINSGYYYTANRDSVGTVSGNPPGFWSSTDTTILVVTTPASGVAQTYAQYETRAPGTAYLKVRSQANPALVDSTRITTALTSVASCTPGTGSLHANATYSTPQTWTVATQPHFVSGQLNFNAGSKLTIEPGTIVCMNSSASFLFHTGSRLIAQGTPANQIKFMAAVAGQYWSELQLGDNSSYGVGAPADTSFITNALIENTYYGVYGYNQHAVVLDTVRIRNFYYNGVQIYAPGSRLSRSVVDTSLYAYPGYYAVQVGRALVENTSIHLGPTGTGIYLYDTATVRNVDIHGGETGIADYYTYSNGAHLNNITIDRTSDIALDLQSSTVAPNSANVVITNGTAGAFRGQIGNLGILFGDSLAQETLKNNGRDTIWVSGGTLARDTVVVRPDLPWVLTTATYVDTLAQLKALPGSTVNVDYWGIQFLRGGTLSAVGTPTKFIRFRATGTSSFYGLRFDSPGAGGIPANAPTAVSTLSYVKIDSAYGQGTNDGVGYSAAIAGGARHRLLMDSVIIRHSYYSAASIAAKGSYLMRSVIDTTGPASSNFIASQPAVVLGDSVLVDSTLVRRSGQIGIYTQGTGVNLRHVRVTNSQAQALSLENGVLAATTTDVRADSANAYPFYGRIENLAMLARDSVTQVQNLIGTAGNADNLAIVTGGALSRDTVAIIPQLRWRIDNPVYVDTLAQLKARPGARIDVNYWGLQFRQGGTLEAIGTPTNFVVFRATGVSTFYGLRFDSPGAGGIPANAPTAISTLQYVRVDSAYGHGNDGIGHTAAISAGARHRVIADSVIVRKPYYGAFALSAKHSSIDRSLVDTTGAASSNFTTSEAAIVAGDSVSVHNTLVRRSGSIGIYTAGQAVDLQNVRVVASRDRALSLETGTLDARSTNVRADSANAYPFYGDVQNLAIIARDSLTQVTAFAGNVDSTLVVTGGLVARDTLVAIKERPWIVTQPTYFDTLSQFRPLPGARINVDYWGFEFQHGGTLLAVGTPTDTIRFRATGASTFYGLRFDSPGNLGPPANAPTAVSTLSYVRIDSAYGHGNDGIGYNAGIAGGARHQLLIDNTWFRKPFYAAVALSAPGSYVTNSRIDTTGFASSNFTTSQPAVVLNDSTSLTNSVVFRSGDVGVLVDGDNISLTNTVIERSLSYGLEVYNNNATNGSNGLALSGFEVRNGAVTGVSIEASNVSLSFCRVHDNGTTTAHHGISLLSTYTNTQIHNCDLLTNAGFGVNNTQTNVTYVINATNNYWGIDPNTGGPFTPTVGNGVSANVTVTDGQNPLVCQASCSNPGFAPIGQGAPNAPAVPATEYVWRRSQRRRRRKPRA